MCNIVHTTVLTTSIALLGLIPLATSAQIAPNQTVICSSLDSSATFKLDGKGEALEARQCRTYSGRSTYLFIPSMVAILDTHLNASCQVENNMTFKRIHRDILMLLKLKSFLGRCSLTSALL